MIIPFTSDRCVVLVKRNTNAGASQYGYSAYTPLDEAGLWWTNWRLSNRTNPGAIGCIRLLDAKIAKLCASTRYSLAANDPERTGSWSTVTPTDIDGIEGVYCTGASLESTVYTVVVPSGGRIVWEYAKTLLSTSKAYIIIRDSRGDEIAAGQYDIATDGTHRYLSLYDGTEPNEIYQSSLASNLAADTYTVTVLASGAVGAGGGARIYDRCCFAIDDATPGNPYTTDPFVDQASPSCALCGNGDNIEYTCRVAQSGAAPADQEYASGMRGYESGPTGLVMLREWTDLKASFDLAATYQGTRWIAREFQVSYSTTVYTRVGSVNLATIGWQHRFTPDGYLCNLYRTALAAGDFTQEMVGKARCPNLPNGGANHIAVGGCGYTVGTTTPEEEVDYTPPANQGAALRGAGWHASIDVAAPYSLEAVCPHANQRVPKTRLEDRPDGTIEDGRATILAAEGLAIPVAAGDACGVQLRYRVTRT